jgi:hypothetical protein
MARCCFSEGGSQRSLETRPYSHKFGDYRPGRALVHNEYESDGFAGSRAGACSMLSALARRTSAALERDGSRRSDRVADCSSLLRDGLRDDDEEDFSAREN